MQNYQKIVTKFAKFAFFSQLFLICQSSFALTSEQLSNLYPVDKDLTSRSNLAFANKNAVKYQYENVVVGKEIFQLGVYEKQPIGNVRYLVIHDSEDASFDSALQTIINHGGRLVVLENREKRGLFDQISQSQTEIDPNRIFFYDENLPLDEQNYYLFSQYILEKLQLNPDSILLALHNNSRYSRFGMTFIHELGDVQIVCQQDAEQKNLFWFTQSDYQNLDKNQVIGKLCEQYSLNVVNENVGETSDKSLSNFAHFHHIDYVNIEIKMGKKGKAKSENEAKDAQIRYINALLKAIN